MSGISCAEVRGQAAEIALGLVAGPERAALLDHLATCGACQAEVDALAAVVDDLLLAAPAAEPPAGFESRVLNRLGPGAVPIWRRRRVVAWLGAAAAALVLVALGVVVGWRSTRGSGGGHGAVVSAAMITPSGGRVGRVELGRDPATVFIAVPGWLPPGVGQGAYRLRFQMVDGSTSTTGPVNLSAEHPAWGKVTTVDTARVRAVALIDRSGRVYCSAHF
ncbi:MAG TPA: hypothetical protein VHA73_12780 [Acidimicrobiales bacterium]|nr:hypothetical protein [Acidimicrobiales bacterium]